MQEPGRRRAAPPFAGVDLRRPKGYAASALAEAEVETPAEAAGDPCPRCESRNTKFCYYNNYNTSQPRHYCKSCRRYWTKGGTLRNVPVGGGSRKSSSSTSSPSPKNPKRAKNSKGRRVAPPAPEPEPAASTDASVALAPGATTTEATTAEDTADDPVAPPVADEGSTDPSVALGLGLTDAGGKEPSDQSPFEWPSGCDLGSYWAPGVFADTDPALFLDLS